MVDLSLGALWVEQEEDGRYGWQMRFNREPTDEELAGVFAVLNYMESMPRPTMVEEVMH